MSHLDILNLTSLNSFEVYLCRSMDRAYINSSSFNFESEINLVSLGQGLAYHSNSVYSDNF